MDIQAEREGVSNTQSIITHNTTTINHHHIHTHMIHTYIHMYHVCYTIHIHSTYIHTYYVVYYTTEKGVTGARTVLARVVWRIVQGAQKEERMFVQFDGLTNSRKGVIV